MRLETILLLAAVGAVQCIFYTDHDYQVLKDTVYGQARGETREGQMAIAHVVLNRVKKNCPRWGGNSIARVCKMPYQFGSWNGVSTMRIGEPTVYRSIDEWLPQLLKEEIPDNTQGSDHCYEIDKLGADQPDWIDNVQMVKDIGKHRFYRSYSNDCE